MSILNSFLKNDIVKSKVNIKQFFIYQIKEILYLFYSYCFIFIINIYF